MIKIYAHGSYVGNTGYNQHTRDFFRHLSKHTKIKLRNFTIGNSWKGYNLTPHDGEYYFNDTDKEILYEQILWDNKGEGKRSDYKIYPHESKDFVQDLNIVLCETNHHIFYDEYQGPKIGYNVWESTLQPQNYFNKLLEFDELWVPSKWQRDCTIAQGYPEDKIKVVPEGVDVNTFYPDDTVTHPLTKDKFTFFLAGRWDYRKSIKEIIETFIKTFDKNEPVELIVSVDNPFSNDGLKTTEERLKHYGLEDNRIKILHFPPREEYIRLLKSCSVFVSCARSEGWNLPLIEAMACGTPSIYSDCSGQLEFAEGNGIPVRISHELPVSASTYNHFNENVGNYYEPDFNDLGEKMMSVYGDYKKYKESALVESEQIREDFNWENIALIGLKTIEEFLEKQKSLPSKPVETNKMIISYLNGPKIEFLGKKKESYHVEFINKLTGEVVFSDTIKNNMWTTSSKKYYIPWQIKVNGLVVDELNLEGKEVLICLESKALGDTLAWAPYSVEFAKKHNCKVILSTFHNKFFEGLESYKDIKFIKPGESHSCYTIYRIGWFKKDGKWGDKDKNPNQVNTIPLQQTVTDILGLDYFEINHGINFKKGNSPLEKPYVIFGPNATSGCKEWDFNHWVTLSKMIKEIGYEVVVLTQKPFYIEGTINVMSGLNVAANYLYHAKAFIGLGSGLSWFNWSLGNHTFMINGFAKPEHEFTTNCTKIYNDNTCIFCWNDEVLMFDAGDWDWCPVYKGTKKQHICQRSITPLQVFNKLKI